MLLGCFVLCVGYKISPWYEKRLELFRLCETHFLQVKEQLEEADPVYVGTYISLARLYYLYTLPPFSDGLIKMKQQFKNQNNKQNNTQQNHESTDDSSISDNDV